jgi:methionyl-tRNA synthetase
MPWGIAVPGDDEQVMYVWFDALVNYISAVGYPDDQAKFDKWVKETGGMVQYCGKDNLRQQSAMWQAMLMAAGLPNSRQIIVEGFITGERGIKMSKSIGNVVNPLDMISEYGADPLRYYLLREVSPFEDSPFSMDLFKTAYNANLANGLGNLVSRIMKMSADNIENFENENLLKIAKLEIENYPKEYLNFLNKFEINKACDFIWEEISSMDKFIQEMKPFKVVKTEKEKGQKMISDLVVRLYSIARMLNPILPETSQKIKELIKQNKTPEIPLFVRK